MSGNERSLSELKRDAETSRANLTVTVDQLRAKMSDTVDEIRERVSPDAIKAAAGDYFRNRGEELMAKARENPLQAAAIGMGLGYPLMRIVRSIPAPVLMVGAGLFLMGTTSGKNATRKIAESAEDLSDRISAGTDALSRKVHDARDSVVQNLTPKGVASSTADRIVGQAAAARTAFIEGASQLKESGAALVSSAFDSAADLRRRATNAPDLATDIVSRGASVASEYVQSAQRSATDFSANSAAQIRDGAVQSSQRATKLITETIQQNPLLIAGLGLAVGGLIANALPRSEVERAVMGGASADVYKRANDAVSQKIEAARDMATGIISDVAHKAKEEGLSADDLTDAARDIGRRARHVAENAATTAFELADDKAATSPKRGSLL